MSRSFKKPYITDYHRAKSFFKREANRKIRNISVYDEISDGKSFRKYFCSYDICDYKFHHDPKPRLHINCRTGGLEWSDPEPIYRYNRK